MNRITSALLLVTLAAATAAAHAGSADIGDDINARLARAKSQQASLVAGRGGAAAQADGVTALGNSGAGISTVGGVLGQGCNIAIGNVIEDKGARISTSARRETTVIVTGDVIQVGNNCR